MNLRDAEQFRLGRAGAALTGLLGLAAWLAFEPAAAAQPRPYVGYVYPAGGQQGTTFQVRLGGQGLDDVQGVIVTGAGVSAKIAENYRRLNNQEMQLINEQLRILRREVMSGSAQASLKAVERGTEGEENSTRSHSAKPADQAAEAKQEATRKLIDRIEKRVAEYESTPASQALASLVLVEVTATPEAEPGEREIRLVTLRGVSNPLAFHIGQVPQYSRQAMKTAAKQILGKESQALRRRPPAEEEDHITLPCTVNGQIASGEVNRYRFAARQGQRLVITTLARQLVPFMADAVPGWFQPVLVLADAQGKEVAYDDDYRFKPDPTLFYEVPKDGEYVFTIRDSLYRGREDFVYRITAGELPFITSIFPLGGPAGAVTKPEVKGWNLAPAKLTPAPANAEPGTRSVRVNGKGMLSNRVPFALDTLPEALEQEPNNQPATAQKVTLPIIINGRINQPDDWDVFQFAGKSNDTVVVEVEARRLDSPLDSIIKLTDAAGEVLAFNDDHEDLAAGLNTHLADSYLTARLPADGTYFVHIGDTARHGGEEYGYRLRISAPQPDFELRVVPSSLALRAKSTGVLTIYAQRKDGFAGPIRLTLQNPPEGFSASAVTLSATQNVGRITIRTGLVKTEAPVDLSIVGTAKVNGSELLRESVAAEDQMQAFLWRHLVPAKDLKAFVFDPDYKPAPKRVARVTFAPRPLPMAPVSTNAVSGTNAATGTNALAAAQQQKFTKQQVAARLRQLRLLFDESLLTDEFYNEKVVECETEL